jgi:hypothetical protein
MNFVPREQRRQPLIMWTIYAHPRDFPDKYVARKFVADGGDPVPTEDVLLANTIAPLRAEMARRGLMRLARSVGDEPQIVEVWL